METKNRILKLCVTGLMAALAYVAFTFLQIKIPTPGGYTSFHLGNTFDVLASLLLGGWLGGAAGAIGMGIGDLLDPVYVTTAPKTIILKLGIGLITGAVAHKVFKIQKLEGKKLTRAVFLSSTAGMAFNCIGEPLFGYFYTAVLLGEPASAAKALASWNAITTCTNAVLTIIIASLLYLALYPRLKNNGTLQKIAPKDA
jgi:uncharacterized membrane protein